MAHSKENSLDNLRSQRVNIYIRREAIIWLHSTPLA